MNTAIKLLKNKKTETIITKAGYYTYYDNNKAQLLVHVPLSGVLCDAENDGVVESIRLYAALGTADGAEIEIQDDSLVVSKGARIVKLPLSSDLSDTRAHSFYLKNTRDTDALTCAVICAKKFVEDCKKLNKTSAKNDIRYFLEGIYFDKEKQAMVASDGHRMTVVKNIEPLSNLSESFIMHSSTVTELCRLIAELGADSITVLCDQENIRVVGIKGLDEVFTLYATSICGRYPDWQRVYNVGCNFYQFSAKELINGVKFLASNDTRQTKTILLDIKNSSASLRISEMVGGACETSVSCTAPSSIELMIGVNTKYFLDLLSNTQKNETVYLNLEGTSKPIVARYGNEANDNIEYVLMPTRV